MERYRAKPSKIFLNSSMAKISEILEVEKQREDAAAWNVIHLFKEGGFYRAYEWSAWLMVSVAYSDEVRKENTDRKPLSVSRKKTRSGDGDFAFVGFPLKSMEKFIPYHTGFVPVSDSQIDVTVELPPMDMEMSYGNLKEAFEAWKESLPVSEDKPKRDGADTARSPRSLTGIMQQVLSYPLESKTPLENIAFIGELKRELAALV